MTDGTRDREADDRGEEDVGISAGEAARKALRHISELTTTEIVGAVSVEPIEDGWLVGVETVEQHRVPSTSDMLAVYEAELDLDGNLLSYKRVRRYLRGRGDDTGAGAAG